jgi:predicted anti-sigma-YlaC factor YlaD
MTDATEPLRFERTYVTGPDYAAKVTSAVYRNLFLKPARLIRLIVLLAIVVILLAFIFISPSPNRVGPQIAVVVFILLFAGLMVGSYFRARRKIAEQIPVGTVYSIGFREDTFSLGSTMVKSELSYRLYTAAVRRGEFVFLTLRSTKRGSPLPAELFTPESLAWLDSKLTR